MKARLFLFIVCVTVACLAKDRYNDNGDGIVTDTVTKLVWQKCSMGLTSDDCTGGIHLINWEKAMQYCNRLTLGNKKWKLPTAQELITIINASAKDPAIDAGVFRFTMPTCYWSATTDPENSGNAKYVNFSRGDVYSGGKTGSCFVRCVSAGQ